MAVKSFTRVETRFKAAAEYAQDQLRDAVKAAVEDGEEVAKARLKPGRGVDTGKARAAIRSEVNGLDGKVVSPGHPETLKNPAWLEFGTEGSKAVPHIRPAHTRMRKRFKAEVGIDLFKGFRGARKSGGAAGSARKF